MSNKSTLFHIKSNDYFGTLATVLSMMRQNMESYKDKRCDIMNIKILKKIENDLMFLQKNYKIDKKVL